MGHHRRLIATLASASLLSGCGNGSGPFGIGALVGDRTLAGAEPLFDDETDRCLNDPSFLLQVFAVDRPAIQEITTTTRVSKAGAPAVTEKVVVERGEVISRSEQNEARQRQSCNDLTNRLRLTLNLQQQDNAASHGSTPTVTGKRTTTRTGGNATIVEEKTLFAYDRLSASQPLRYTLLERNEMVDALIAASDRKCGRYTEFLKSYDGGVNSSLAIASIVTAGLGGIVGGVTTAKALSGSSAILNGSRSALNEVHFTNQTIQVLSAAYEAARKTQRRDISNRQACPVEYYSLMRGFADALTYHNSCSIVTGLQSAATSIQRAANPGLDTLRSSLSELSALRRQAAAFAVDAEVTLPPKVETTALATIDEARTALTKADAGVQTANGKVTAAEAAQKNLSATATQTEKDDAAKTIADEKKLQDGAVQTQKLAQSAFERALVDYAALRGRMRNAIDAESGQTTKDVVHCPFTENEHDAPAKAPDKPAAS